MSRPNAFLDDACPERRALSDAAIKRRAIAYKCPTFNLVGRAAEVIEGAYEFLLTYIQDTKS